MVGSSIGLMMAMMVENTESLGALTPILLLPQILVAGFFAQVKTITWPLFIFSYLSAPRFIFQGFMSVEFQNADLYRQNCKIRLPCQANPESLCWVQLSPEKADICDPRLIFDFYETQVWLNFVISIILMVVFRMIAYFGFLYKFRELKTNIGFDQELFDQFCKTSPQEAFYRGKEQEKLNGRANSKVTPAKRILI